MKLTKNFVKKLATFGCVSLLTVSAYAQVKVEPDTPSYKKTSGVSGTLNSIGSDTLLNLMTSWSEEYRKMYPSVNFQIEGKGSSTAPPALIEGTAQFGPMSREMKSSEIEKIKEKYGFEPVKIPVAVDALAVFVNKNNPLEELSLEQTDAIFSQNRKSGYAESIDTWGQTGLTGDWQNKPISKYGRNSASGTYSYFKEVALFKGDYKKNVKEQPGSSSVVQSIGVDPYGIGYSGIGYSSPNVKTLKISKKTGQTAYGTDPAAVYSGNYPLSRFLYVYVIKDPRKPLEKNVEEFLKLVLSKQGQEITAENGYLPLPAKVVKAELNKLK